LRPPKSVLGMAELLAMETAKAYLDAIDEINKAERLVRRD
jgi:hypothetical protein